MTTAIIDFIFILLYYLHRKKSIDVNSVGHHDEFYGQLSHHENGVQRTQSRNPQLTKLFKWPTQNVSSNDNFLQINTKNLTYTVYSEIRCIALLILQTSKEFWVFLFRQSF